MAAFPCPGIPKTCFIFDFFRYSAMNFTPVISVAKLLDLFFDLATKNTHIYWMCKAVKLQFREIGNEIGNHDS